jgi:hypothetical protein
MKQSRGTHVSVRIAATTFRVKLLLASNIVVILITLEISAHLNWCLVLPYVEYKGKLQKFNIVL